MSKDCDCTHFPYRPHKCVKICGGALVFHASDDYLATVVKLKSNIVQKISQSRTDKPWESLDDLAEILSEDELSEVIATIKKYSDTMADEQMGPVAMLEEATEAEERIYERES